MMPDNAFTQAALRLKEKTSLTEPQARGSIRLALRQGGCNATDVTAHQLAVIFRRVMPQILEAQGLPAPQAQEISEQIATSLEQAPASNRPDAASVMFDRIDRETFR